MRGTPSELVAALNGSSSIPVRIVHQPVLIEADGIRRQILAANSSDRCVGVIAWMHTFSPAKMWIAGLSALQKPLLHLHTQFNRDLPWGADRHGLHEPEPVGARRPRVRPPADAHGRRAQDGRRARERPRRRRADRHLVSRRLRLAGGAVAARRAVRRQHARRRRHRGGQGRGADPASASRSTATASAILPRRSRGAPDEVVEALLADYEEQYELVEACAPGGARRDVAGRRGSHRGGPALVSRRARLQGVHRHVRGSARAAPVAGHCRAAADGRRLRLRRARATGRPRHSSAS